VGKRDQAPSSKTPADLLNEAGIEMLDSEALRGWPEAADDPVLVMFAAPWCEVCLAAAPAFAVVCADAGSRVAARHVDADRAALASERLGIRSVPTIALFARHKEVARRVELSTAEELRGFIERALEEVPAAEPAPDGAHDEGVDGGAETGADA
jgi:thioredoxin 2